mgnify:CR=1 FL=1
MNKNSHYNRTIFSWSIYDFANQGKYILIEMGATWCSPCRKLASYLTFQDLSITKDRIWRSGYEKIYDMVENNQIYLGEDQIAFDELISKVKIIAGTNNDIRIFLRADTSINYGEVMKVLGALNTSGFLKIALVTKKPS